jgi:hypothetical protein
MQRRTGAVRLVAPASVIGAGMWTKRPLLRAPLYSYAIAWRQDGAVGWDITSRGMCLNAENNGPNWPRRHVIISILNADSVEGRALRFRISQ